MKGSIVWKPTILRNKYVYVVRNVYYLISDKIKGQPHKKYITNVIYYKFSGLSLEFIFVRLNPNFFHVQHNLSNN